MDPITGALVIGGVASLGSGIAQWLNSREAQKASAAETKRLQGLLDKIQEPTFDTRDITPQELRVLEQYSPQIAQFVEEPSPELVQAMSEGAQKGRRTQLDSLDKFQELAKTGNDPILALQQARAQRQAASQAASARTTLDEANQRRGIGLGSGVGYAGQMQAIQDAQLQQALAGEQANADAYQRQVLNLQNAANLGGQIRNEDVDLESRNVGALNDYNRRIADMRNTYNQYATGLQNNAQMFNQQQNQNVYQQNVANRYNAQVANRDYANDAAQNVYGNKLRKLGINSELAGQRRADAQMNAQINNRAIQGVSDAVNTGAMTYASYNDPKRERLTRN